MKEKQLAAVIGRRRGRRVAVTVAGVGADVGEVRRLYRRRASEGQQLGTRWDTRVQSRRCTEKFQRGGGKEVPCHADMTYGCGGDRKKKNRSPIFTPSIHPQRGI